MAEEDGRDGHWAAVAELYHGFTTGYLLTVVSRRSVESAARMWFRLFRRQHEDMFLPGLGKLGISHLPDAVKAAQYHYLSNSIGGVKVEYMYESDRKAWVRFPPPRWIYDGTAICGVPTEVSRAILQGWYAQNGVSLKNPRLGFVCTAQTMDGQHGLAGYFREYDRDLAPDERLVFSPGEEPPPFDPAQAPRVDRGAWPAGRLKKASRNYSMNYVRTILAESAALFGPAEATYLGRITGQLIGLQYYDRLRAAFDVLDDTAAAFGDLLMALGAAQDDPMDMQTADGEVIVRQSGWRLMRGVDHVPHCAFDAWNGLWEGALMAHNRFLTIEPLRRLDFGDEFFEWRIRARGPSRIG